MKRTAYSQSAKNDPAQRSGLPGKRISLGRMVLAGILLLLWNDPSGYGQAAEKSPTSEGFFEATTAHYRVLSQVSPSQAEELGAYLEQLYELFNTYFHFSDSPDRPPLLVRMFQSKEPFDRHLSLFLNESREDFVYLHHPDPSRRELLLYQSDPEVFYPSLHHQAFLQFLRAHVQNPPLWIREGFAVFFEKVGMDPGSKKLQFKENLDWLDFLKDSIDTASSSSNPLIPLERFLFLTPEEARNDLKTFYAQAWGFITFLLYSENRDYQRFLWDSIGSLQSGASLDENNQAIRKRVLSFYDPGKVEQDFKTYIEERPSFASLMKAGISAYEKEAYEDAQAAFTQAVSILPDDPLPYYYLGLIAYTMKDYAHAEEQYRKSLSLGGPKGLIHYALGVNAFAWNKPAEARTYLTTALEEDPSFKEKVAPLLKRLSR